MVTNPVGVASEQVSGLARSLGHAASAAAGTSMDLARTAITNPVGAAHSAATLDRFGRGGHGRLDAGDLAPAAAGQRTAGRFLLGRSG